MRGFHGGGARRLPDAGPRQWRFRPIDARRVPMRREAGGIGLMARTARPPIRPLGLDRAVRPGLGLHRPPRPPGQRFAPGRRHSMQTQRVEPSRTIKARTLGGRHGPPRANDRSGRDRRPVRVEAPACRAGRAPAAGASRSSPRARRRRRLPGQARGRPGAPRGRTRAPSPAARRGPDRPSAASGCDRAQAGWRSVVPIPGTARRCATRRVPAPGPASGAGGRGPTDRVRSDARSAITAPSAATRTMPAVLRAGTARPANSAGAPRRPRSGATGRVLETLGICSTRPSNGAVAGRGEGRPRAGRSAMDRSGAAGCLRPAGSRQRAASRSLNASKPARRAGGANGRPLVLPTRPCSRPDAGARAAGSNG